MIKSWTVFVAVAVLALNGIATAAGTTDMTRSEFVAQLKKAGFPLGLIAKSGAPSDVAGFSEFFDLMGDNSKPDPFRTLNLEAIKDSDEEGRYQLILATIYEYPDVAKRDKGLAENVADDDCVAGDEFCKSLYLAPPGSSRLFRLENLRAFPTE